MKEITIKIEGKEWETALDKAFEKANKKVKIDGFRKGKTPKDIFLKKYRKESLFMDAADECINSAYVKMLDDNKDLEIVAQPELSLKSLSEDGVEFVFKLTLKPEVKLGKYKGLKVKKDSVKVTKEEIDETITSMRNRYAENVNKDGKVENGDTAIIDFEGFKDGKAFDGGKGENYSLKIGSNTFIPGFEDQVIGMKKGETKDINVTFPEDYHAEDLKGCPVVFKVTVNEIKETVIPDLDDDFFADLGMEGITNEKELKDEIKEQIKVRKETDADNKFIDELLKAAAKNMKVEIPEVMINDEVSRMINQYSENLKMQGLTIEQFYKFTNSDEQALRDQMKEEATSRVEARLLLEALVKEEKIEVSDKDVKKEAKDLAKKYQMEEEDFLKAFGGIEMVKYDMEMRKAMETLKDLNK